MTWAESSRHPDFELELLEFEQFARAHPCGRHHIMRWSKTTANWTFGYVDVSAGRFQPVVHIPWDGEKVESFPFTSIDEIIDAGWTSD